eukprot:scaffold105418_cov30-Tisochrysis_lutea.AAC.3
MARRLREGSSFNGRATPKRSSSVARCVLDPWYNQRKYLAKRESASGDKTMKATPKSPVAWACR